MIKIDLHLHSNYSNDAEFSPAELVDLCLSAGITHAAIADHNSARGVQEGIEVAKGTGLTIISGIEMDCVFDGIELHLLGFGIDHHAHIFEEIEADVYHQEKANSFQMMQLVRQVGIEFDDEQIEELTRDGVVTGEMIARAALIYDEDAKNPLLDPYRDGGDRSDNPFTNFYWDYCSQGKPAYMPMNFLSLAEAIEVIHLNGGVPVLAHPGVNVKENSDLLEGIIATGISGIEVYSSYHDPDQTEFYEKAALEHHLLMTCGSDFHGNTKPSIMIGSTDCKGQDRQIISKLIQKMSGN
ncbi:MAG: PHP domain-containing protein [Brevefilum sp.]